MFNALKAILSGKKEKDEVANDSTNDIRLAEASLLFHIMAVDDEYSAIEYEKLKQIIGSKFSLDSTEVEDLLALADKREQEAVDLYGFTHILRENLDQEQKLSLVENIWEIIYADGVVDELEDNTVWRVAELLNISSGQRLALKRKVRDRAKTEAG